MRLIHIKDILLFRVLFRADATVLERTMAQRTVAYLERRYSARESEIADALRQSATDNLAIADLKYRKLIIADEIQHNRRLVERFSKLTARWGDRQGSDFIAVAQRVISRPHCREQVGVYADAARVQARTCRQIPIGAILAANADH